MIDELRIKCPSCGLILDVRNSKHEAAKTIACPGCKKMLAIDFQEKPVSKPIPDIYYGKMPVKLHEGINTIPIPDCAHLEINVVRISDGSCKCIVRSLSADFPIYVNDTKMEVEDKTVLDVGDQLKIGETILVYGKITKKEDAPVVKGRLLGEKPPEPHHSYRWLFGFLSLMVAGGLVFLLWPSKKDVQPVTEDIIQNQEISAIEDTLTRENTPQIPSTEDVTPPVPSTKVVPPPVQETIVEPGHSASPSYSNMDPYDLELQAGNDVSAQFELGKRLINTDRHALGVSYLRRAAEAGHTGAQQLLDENGW